MRVGELLFRISEAGVTLTYASDEDRLNAKPTSALTPELIAEITKNKEEIIQLVREDEEMRRTGIIQSERQAFEVARDFFGLIGKAGAVTSALPVVRRIPKPSGRLEAPPKQGNENR